MPTREELLNQLARLGAQTRDSVTSKTSILIIGEDYGTTKLERARQLGVQTISWPMFCALGIGEADGDYKLRDVPPEIARIIIIQLAIAAESAYAISIAKRSRRHFRTAARLIAGANELLRISWEPTAGDRAS